MRMRSPNRAPPVKGLVGSTATTATRWPAARYAVTRRSTRVDLPAPGGPVMPIRRAWPTNRWTSASSRSNPGRAFSTTEIARARAAVLPACRPASRRSGSMGERSPGRRVEASRCRSATSCRSATFRGAGDRLVQVHCLVLVLDVELLLGGPVDDEHEDHADHERTEEPQLHSANLAQQQRGTPAHEVAEPREDGGPHDGPDAIDDEELDQGEFVKAPEQHARRLGAIHEPR